ncbi:membrane lipoprotein [Francisella sp. SYW-9]|uniref:membrane lipoprotein n=1 Tax=Francisella sp. SYW-9 TaxID=2610888 RepID=UPI00123DD203|nr:membrane lipoprotein [Francisella sp. SYW-9]
MKKILNNIFIAYVSGLISACVLYFAFTYAKQQGILLDDTFKYTLYRLMVWGGVWSILFASPVPKNILIKTVIIGAAVILFNFLVLMPHAGQGYFGVNAGDEVIRMNIVFNSAWALVAGFIYRVVVINEV